MKNKNFSLIGAAGYIAPRHLDAIKYTENNLIAALDNNDSVGIIDSYFPNAAFFTETERFDRHIEKVKLDNIKIDYTSICSPNYLHDAHIRMALRWGSNAICEKPLVLNPWNIDALIKLQSETKLTISTILQLRLHDSVIKLKEKIDKSPDNKVFDVDLTYITSRGLWYYTSWKGDEKKSGGIATNIGVHFFDMLGFVFGKITKNTIHVHSHDRAAGYLEFKRARVRWFLSINEKLLPKKAIKNKLKTYRSISIEGEEFEFSKGFTELHRESYKQILDGKGFSLKENKQAIDIVYNIRNSRLSPLKNDYHPLAKEKSSDHPFL